MRLPHGADCALNALNGHFKRVNRPYRETRLSRKNTEKTYWEDTPSASVMVVNLLPVDRVKGSKITKKMLFLSTSTKQSKVSQKTKQKRKLISVLINNKATCIYLTSGCGNAIIFSQSAITTK